MNSHWLVTGCAGFVGSHLVEALLARGDFVHGVDCFTSVHDPPYTRAAKLANLAAPLEHPGFRLEEFDVAECPSDMLRAAHLCDGVFHLAAQPGVHSSWGNDFAWYTWDNVVATQQVFEAALHARVPVVYASSSSVYGNAATTPTSEDAPRAPLSPYGVTKLACEHLAGAYTARGLHAVGLRYFTVYGPRQRPDMAFARIIDALANDRQFTMYGDPGSRDFTYVADAVTATIAAMDAPDAGGFYNVGGGEATTLTHAISMLEQTVGKALRVTHGRPAPGDVRRTSADTRRARRELGWEPVTRLDIGLALQADWALRQPR